MVTQGSSLLDLVFYLNKRFNNFLDFFFQQEIFEAITSGCNIIPVSYDFEFPKAEQLPEDIRDLLRFNAVQWNHDYQDACVDKMLVYEVA